MALELMYITNDPTVALIAEKNGVDRIWVDLEILGKQERQKNIDSVKSKHTIEDVAAISKVLAVSKLQVRINPWHDGSKQEIEQVIAAGADIIMLPMWNSFEEVDAFLTAVGKRVHTVLLLETREAENCLDEVLKHPMIDEMHIGLNDLHLSYGMTFMFELLADGTVERICNKMKSAGIKYGFGGIARIGEGMLPAEMVIMEHYRLGSTRAILSRSFCNTEIIKDASEIETVFSSNMAKIRAYEHSLTDVSPCVYDKNKSDVFDNVEKIVMSLRGRKNA